MTKTEIPELTCEGKIVPFLKSEDCGYTAGRIMLPLSRMDTAVIAKWKKGNWKLSVVRDQAGRSTETHFSLLSAMTRAAQMWEARGCWDGFSSGT